MRVSTSSLADKTFFQMLKILFQMLRNNNKRLCRTTSSNIFLNLYDFLCFLRLCFMMSHINELYLNVSLHDCVYLEEEIKFLVLHSL